ncbi:MAG TPA: DNA-3-methyladenine glycosylase 2 family protein [Acidimicrobiia bacterium]|nr:DNA-3-methyladenine glycosylase 2 family protein [Acidimicrobiia bacterium]
MTQSTRSVPIEVPLDLKATLLPLHGWFADDGWWLTARTPDGPGTIRIRRTREEIVGHAWGEGAGWLLAGLGSMVGLDDDPAAFRTDHPTVARLHGRHPGWRFGRTGLVFEALVRAITGQKVTGSEAVAAMRGLRRRFGDRAPGPRAGLRLPPDPDRMAESPYWVYHELHLEKRRADLLRRVAAVGDRIDRLHQLEPDQAAETLLAFPGIGPWTVAKTLAVSHGDPDQVEVGDFHLKHMVVHHLTGRPRGSDEEMLELLEPFRPHRGRVTRLLHTLGHEPAFGPRLAPKDITGI